MWVTLAGRVTWGIKPKEIIISEKQDVGKWAFVQSDQSWNQKIYKNLKYLKFFHNMFYLVHYNFKRTWTFHIKVQTTKSMKMVVTDIIPRFITNKFKGTEWSMCTYKVTFCAHQVQKLLKCQINCLLQQFWVWLDIYLFSMHIFLPINWYGKSNKGPRTRKFLFVFRY